MPSSAPELLVARRYLDRGFLDTAMALFYRHADLVAGDDWALLAERLMDRGRVSDVVRVCERGGVPLPRTRLLDLGDTHLKRRDLDGAQQLYELAGADADRWARLVDALTAIPERARLAIELAARHLLGDTVAGAPA